MAITISKDESPLMGRPPHDLLVKVSLFGRTVCIQDIFISRPGAWGDGFRHLSIYIFISFTVTPSRVYRRGDAAGKRQGGNHYEYYS